MSNDTKEVTLQKLKIDCFLFPASARAQSRIRWNYSSSKCSPKSNM